MAADAQERLSIAFSNGVGREQYGEDVQKVQERLNELGYNCGTADGVFGNKTEIASKNFKHDAGLKNETGTIGKKTAEALGFEWQG